MLTVTRSAVTALRSTRTLATSSLPAVGALRTKYTLPDLPYDYNAVSAQMPRRIARPRHEGFGNKLFSVTDTVSYVAEIMQLHHSKHHQTYVNGINAAEEKLGESLTKKDLRQQIELQSALKFNGGGHINHSIFWTNLAPQSQGGGEAPKGELLRAINSEFGSLEDFQKKFAAQTAAVQGSGWGWLAYNKATKKLEIATTANQDPLISHVPLLGVDVWEHAYYLQYKNVRPDYLKAIWSVVNWKNVAERHAAVAK
ncbi:Superoxide dismutase [Mn], mitochondrial [Thoreauomyces humboldtii]|nr:Superoxide dismutase [Mn], mitochondrial [Thoreauomyces humboldtii]